MTIRTKIATFGIIAALAGGMVGTSAPIASAAPVAAPTATSYFRAGATVNFPTTWTAGQPLTVIGQGFRTRSGRSVTVVLRGDEGEIYHEVRPDANGKFTTSIPWSNSLQAGQSIEFETFALTRGGFYEGSEVDVRVVAAPARQNPAPQPKTTTGAAQKPAEKDKSGENKNGGGADGGGHPAAHTGWQRGRVPRKHGQPPHGPARAPRHLTWPGRYRSGSLQRPPDDQPQQDREGHGQQQPCTDAPPDGRQPWQGRGILR